MEKQEVKTLIGVISATYPSWKIKDLKFTLDVWHDLLKDYGKKDISDGFRVYSLTDRSGFAPSPGQIVNCIPKINERLTEAEACSLFIKALRNSGYYSEEEFEKLPKEVQKAIGSASSLREMALNSHTNLSVETSNFKRTYRNVIEQRETQSLLPNKLKNMELEEK